MLCLIVQSCLTLCDPWNVAHQAPLSIGILQPRILEWVTLSSSRGYSQPQRSNPGLWQLQAVSLLSEPPEKPDIFVFLCLTSLTMTISRSIRVTANSIISFYFMIDIYSILHIYHIFFIHSSIDGYLGLFCPIYCK